jgi:isopenicillin N synthase-like dioxygenase
MAIPVIDLADDPTSVAVSLGAAPRRTSIAFFHNANWDARIECLPGLGLARYAPVSAGRHLMEKFQRTVGG